MRTFSNEKDFDLHENGREGGTHFHMNGFARRLASKQRQKVTRKWPILCKVNGNARQRLPIKLRVLRNYAGH